MAFVLAEPEAAPRARLERAEAKAIAERLKVARQALEGLKAKP